MKDVVGFEEYFSVTEKGEVFSKRSNKFLKQVELKSGYLSLATKINGVNKTFRVHREIAKAFLNNPENKPHVNHKDGNKLNNEVDNLEWCTQSENMKHAVDTGLLINGKGEDCHVSKLTDKDVTYIRQNYAPRNKRFGSRALANRFNVAHSTISDIINYKTWTHI